MNEKTENPSEPQLAPSEAALNEVLQTAIDGYMENRQALIDHFSTLYPQYESHQKKRDWIVEEFQRIDRCVAELLSAEKKIS